MDGSAELPRRQAFTTEPFPALERAGAAVCAAFFETERFRGAAEVLQQIAALRAARATTTGFQTEQWLSALLRDVAPHAAAEPILVVLRRRSSGAVALAVPLVIRSSTAFRTAEFADLGLSDYCAPLLGVEPPKTPEEAAQLTSALRAALSDVDTLRLEKMPAFIEGRHNPLVLPARAQPSRFCGNQLTVTTTVADYIASRGKKYRKESERSRRRLEDQGTLTFTRAISREEIDLAYQQLEIWQAARHRELGHEYGLDRPEVSAFYRNLLVADPDQGFASLFKLEVDGQLVAVLLGITHAKTFTLLRIADAGEAWRHCSPGRMAVIEAMDYLVARGVTTFDMGIGDYPFKRWIGCQPYPLYDRMIATSAAGYLQVLADRLKRRLRANPALLAIVRRIRNLADPAKRGHPPL